MSLDYSYFKSLRRQPERLKPQGKSVSDSDHKTQKSRSRVEFPYHDGIPVLAAVGPAAEF
ncbi:hypothetical protein DLM45_06715 [Hyphomicrobium methylovorum]|nr:hypothetical protein [Hyphomicrobium methylovorum]